MPLKKPELLGTEKDGSKNNEYCTYCYQNGAFSNPEMTLEEMKVLVINQMEQRNIDKDIIKKATTSLPYLKRWKRNVLQ
jgi:hypothetical protein